jgi:hypothetical protein
MYHSEIKGGNRAFKKYASFVKVFPVFFSLLFLVVECKTTWWSFEYFYFIFSLTEIINEPLELGI